MPVSRHTVLGNLLMLIQSTSLFILVFVDFFRSSLYLYVSRRSLVTFIHAGIVIYLFNMLCVIIQLPVTLEMLSFAFSE